MAKVNAMAIGNLGWKLDVGAEIIALAGPLLRFHAWIGSFN